MKVGSAGAIFYQNLPFCIEVNHIVILLPPSLCKEGRPVTFTVKYVINLLKQENGKKTDVQTI